MDEQGPLEQADTQLKEAQALLQSGDSEAAEARFRASLSQLVRIRRSDDPPVLALRAAAHDGLLVLAGQREDPEAAFEHHRDAVLARHRLEERTGERRDLPIAITHLNMAHTAAASGELGEAEAMARRARRRLEQAEQTDEVRFLLVGTNQLVGLMLTASKRLDEGLEALDAAVAVARELPIHDTLPAGGALVQALMNAAVVRHDNGHNEKACELGAEAAERARELAERFEGQPEPLEQWIASQLNLITFNQGAGHFAAAEDALFRVLDVLPGQPEVIARGKAFYMDLLGRGDEELEAGELPREEVQESLAELIAMEQEHPA